MPIYTVFAGVGLLICAGLARGPQAALVGSEPRALAAGKALYQQLGCVGCHEPELCGGGPELQACSAVPFGTRSVELPSWTNRTYARRS
jgi:hypothetical protein